MIDIHTHIIPNVDDGARNPDETFSIIDEAKNARIYRYNINTTLYD